MIKILAPFLAFALLVGCAGGKPATLGEHGSSETPGVISFRGGGSAEPWYEKPVRMTDGSYRPPAANEEAQRRGIAAAQAEERKPKFTGRVNGFRLYPPAADFPAKKRYCREGAVVTFSVSNALTFSYLPPGTFARTPQYAGLCPDGSVAFVTQSFQGDYFVLDIGYEPGERAFDVDAAPERISAGSVGTRPAVFVAPLTPEGFGDSIVAFATSSGFIMVAADNLPLEQTVRIAEGVSCGTC